MTSLTKQKTELIEEFEKTFYKGVRKRAEEGIGVTGTRIPDYICKDVIKIVDKEQAWLSQALDTIASAAREEAIGDMKNAIEAEYRSYGWDDDNGEPAYQALEKMMSELRSHLKEKQK